MGTPASSSALRWGLAALLVLIVPFLPEGSPGVPVERLLLVTVDTLRADHVGAYGGSLATPSMDTLAAEGAVVVGACTPTPSTGPAHASLFTGLHPWRHGVLDNAVPLGPQTPTLTTRLRERGFATAAFVSSFVVDERFGLGRGFDLYSFEPTEAYHWRGRERGRFWARGESVVSAALGWVTAHAAEPFFVWVHLFDPHRPYLPPPGYSVAPDSPVDLSAKRVPQGVAGRRQLADLVRAYRGEVAYADAQLGRLVERLRLLDLLEGTAVVVTSDHGEGLGDHGLLEHGANLHEELVRVPLIVRAPGIAPGTRLEGDAQLEDLAPTLLALAGVDPPEDLDGVNLLPWLQGRVDSSPRRAVLGRRKSTPGRRDLFYTRRHVEGAPEKWIGGRGGRGVRYQLGVDPQELQGEPAAAPPDEILPALAGDAGPAPERAMDAQTRRALEALGYLGEGSDSDSD